MKHVAGLWLDHHQAIIVHVEEDRLRVEHIKSEAMPHIRPQGGYGSGNSGMPQDVMKESSFQERLKHALKTYYEDLSKRMENASRVLIMGPGEARIEFGKALSESTAFRGRIDDIRPADKMTENQIVASVRKHFDIPDTVPVM